MPSPLSNSFAPRLPDTAAAARIRHILASAGYDEAHLYPLLADPGVPAPDSIQYSHALHRTVEPSALNTLARLFVLAQPVSREQAERTLPFGAAGALEEAGLLAESGNTLHPTVSIMPYDGLLIAFDMPHQSTQAAREDMVMSVSGSSMAVARSAVRLPRRRALDLGTGNGYLALLAARWSEQVVATDVSPRALAFAEFNANLNGVSNIEFRQGDKFAPVAGEHFDQIVCNPPFAITPGTRFLYRDGGEHLDGFCCNLASAAGAYLEENGIFQMVCDWVQCEGETAEAALRSWFEDSGCEVFAWKDDSRDPVRYAEAWVVETEDVSGDRMEPLLEQWVAFYESHHVKAIHTAYVLMRKRRTRPPDWFHLDTMPLMKSGEFGAQLWRQVASRDFLRSFPSNDGLLQAAVRAAPELVLRQECEWHSGAWAVLSTRLRLNTGIGREALIDQGIMGLIARCDGAHSLLDIVLEMAKALHVSSDSLIEPSMRVVRGLIEEGFLIPETVRRNVVN